MEYKLKVAYFFIISGHPVDQVLKYSSIHKNTWYRQKNKTCNGLATHRGRPIPNFSFNKFGTKITDDKIVAALIEIRDEEFTMIAGGYKKLKFYLLDKYGYIVNQKKIYRLCK